ncbi:MAG: carboxymuconolactone decarboxylase family protein [Planctomycetota bacterium]
MTGLSALTRYEDATPEVREIYDEIRQTLGVDELPHWVLAFGGHARLLRGNWEKVRWTLVESDLPPLLRELILFAVSIQRGSKYCSACHAHAALQVDKSLSYEDLRGLSEAGTYNGLPESFRVAIDTAVKAATDPATVGEAEFTALTEQGFCRQEIGEVLAHADLAVMFNTITMTYDLPVDEAYHAVQGQVTTPQIGGEDV